MDKRVNLFKILKQEGKLEKLLVYNSIETQLDRFEKNTSKVYMNPIPIKAIVIQDTPESLRWKYYGRIPEKAIKIITELKNETLIRTADKIKYGDEYFCVWKDDSQNFMITKRSDYIIVRLGLKNE